MRIFLILALLCGSVVYGEDHPGLESLTTRKPMHPGLKKLATRAYSPAIMDEFVFANLWRSWDPSARDLAAKAPEETRRKMTLDRYGLLEAPFDNGGAPLGMVVDENGGYAISCLICHAGSVAGQTVMGVANTAVDFSAIYEDTASTVELLHGDKPGTPPFAEGLITMTAAGENPKSIHFPEGSLSVFRGTTNSFTFSVHFLSVRDEDLNLVAEPHDLGPTNHYLDPPALWHSNKKKSYYFDGFTEKSVRALMQFSLDPSVEPERFKSWEKDYEDIYDWVHTVEAPRYQGAIDKELAAHGEQVYMDTCVKCHGTPGPGGEYKNKIVSIAKVKTDRSRLDSLSPEFKKHFSASWMGYYGEGRVRTSALGYVSPPLDGIWASPPYFHNGSVPTLYHVLFPGERPDVWKVKDYDAYDHEKGGLLVEEHTEVPAGVQRSERRAFYDTRQRSMGNTGHPFADELSEEQRLSLLEFLKTL